MRLRRTNEKRTRRQPAPLPLPTRPISPSQPAAPQSSPDRRANLGRFWMQRAGLIILFVAALASAVNVLSLSTDSKVVPLTGGSDSSLLRPMSVYQTAVIRELNRSIWNHNKLTVDTTGLSRQLLNQFPELSSVNVTVPLLAHRPVVYVEATQPALILVTGDGSFIIDTTGKALIENATPVGLNQPRLPLLSDQSGLHIQVNHQALPGNNVIFIQTVVAELAAKQFTVSNMTLPAAASELDVHLTGQPYYVKFNLENNNPKEQAGTFLATITQLRRQNITPAHYVDVRVDGRAYYQ